MIIYIHLHNGDKNTILKVVVHKTQQQATHGQELSVIPRWLPRLPQTLSEVTCIRIDKLLGEARVTWLIRLLCIKIQEFYFFVLTMREAAKDYDVCTKQNGEREMAILKGIS